MSICDLIHGVIYGLYIGEGRLLDSYTLWQVHCIKFRNRGGCVPACLPSYIYFIDKKKRKKKNQKLVWWLKKYVCCFDFFFYIYLKYKTNIKTNLVNE
jgi:hypothetical protein